MESRVTEDGPFQTGDAAGDLFEAVRALLDCLHARRASSDGEALPRSDRKLWTFVALTCVTFGLYPVWYLHCLARDMNILCVGDGDKTAGVITLLALTVVTCGIYPPVVVLAAGRAHPAQHAALRVSHLHHGVSIMLLATVGVPIVVGPFIAWRKIIDDVNAMACSYNEKAGIYEGF